jgi:hypothetical protein
VTGRGSGDRPWRPPVAVPRVATAAVSTAAVAGAWAGVLAGLPAWRPLLVAAAAALLLLALRLLGVLAAAEWRGDRPRGVVYLRVAALLTAALLLVAGATA